MNTEKFRAYFLVTSFVITVAMIIAILASTHSGDVLAWTEFWTFTASGVMSYSLGYRVITHCYVSEENPESNRCFTQSLENYDRSINGVCHKGGIGVIVAYAFTMIASFLAVGVLFSGKGYSGKIVNNANIVTLLTLIALGLSIVPVGTWYANCQSVLSGASVSYRPNPTAYSINDIQAGAGIGLGATIIAVYLVASIVSIWRSVVGCVENNASVYNTSLMAGSVYSSDKAFSSSSKMPWNQQTSATNNFSISVHSDL